MSEIFGSVRMVWISEALCPTAPHYLNRRDISTFNIAASRHHETYEKTSRPIVKYHVSSLRRKHKHPIRKSRQYPGFSTRGVSVIHQYLIQVCNLLSVFDSIIVPWTLNMIVKQMKKCDYHHNVMVHSIIRMPFVVFEFFIILWYIDVSVHEVQ